MDRLRYTLLSDGSSNKTLLPIITWLLQRYFQNVAIQGEWADLRILRNPPSRDDIPERIRVSLDLYPCDLLFIHRDAETATIEQRISEIDAAVKTARDNDTLVPPTIPVVPVRMLEAWFLFDTSAIGWAAGNPAGAQSLHLPRPNTLENLSNPKEILYDLLRNASGFSGRRLKVFNHRSAFHRIPDFIEDFTPLRNLSSFQAIENSIQQIVPSFR